MLKEKMAQRDPAVAPSQNISANYHHFTQLDDYKHYWETRPADKITVVDYSSSWCGPCKKFEPVYQRIATQYPYIDFVHVTYDYMTNDCSEHELLPDLGDIDAFPTFKFFIDGLQTQVYDYEKEQYTYRLLGANPQNLLRGLHSTTIAKMEIGRHLARANATKSTSPVYSQ